MPAFKPLKFSTDSNTQSKQSIQSTHVTKHALPDPEVSNAPVPQYDNRWTQTKQTNTKDPLKKEDETTTEEVLTTTEAIPDTTSAEEDYEEYGEYDDESKEVKVESKEVKSIRHITQNTSSQRQHIVLDPLEDLDATVIQTNDDTASEKILQPGEAVPGSPGVHIPAGFRGKITSIAGDKGTASFGPNSQAQTVTLSPGTGRIIYQKPVYIVGSKTHFKSARHGQGYGSGYSYQPVTYQLKSGGPSPKFYSVTKSESGSQNALTGKKTPVYYSQSSSCGYFTNTCVYTGGKKVCLPKPKLNPDGSPMAC